MSLSRRSFFGLFGASSAAVVAASPLATALKPTQLASGVAIVNEAKRWDRFLDLESRIIHRSFRLLGIMRPGECCGLLNYQAAQVALGQVLDAWREEGRACPTELAVTYGLAFELAPEYNVRRRELHRYASYDL